MIKTDDRGIPKAAIRERGNNTYRLSVELQEYSADWSFPSFTDATLYLIFLELHEISNSLYTLRQKK